MSTRTLVIHWQDGSTQAFELRQPLVRIGRADDNDIVLKGNRVSRVHAQIACNGDSPALLTDLNSANGVMVNGTVVQNSISLFSEDVLRIGPYMLVYSDQNPSAQRPKTDSSISSPFHIEAASLDLNELQQQSFLLPIADSSIELRSLELLHEVGVTLARTVTVEDVIEAAVALLFKIDGVHRARLMLWDEKTLEFKAADEHSRTGIDVSGPGFDPRRVLLSSTILRRVRQENRPLHIQDVTSDAALSGAMSVVHAGIRAAFCSPLTFQGRLMGVLYADNLSASNAFSAADFRLFTTIAAQTGLAMASAFSRGELMKREVEQAAMRLYMPSQVADLISATEGGIELGGVMQNITVLFADIRGFSRLSELMDARDVVLLLNEFFTVMTKLILDSGGTLDKYIGDCVMALFGAPVPSADDAERALAAAVGMQQAMVRLNARLLDRAQPEINIGIGLHSGTAVVGNIGSDQRMQYTAVGDTVNVAARLVAQATAGQVLVSEEFTKGVEKSDVFEHLGEVPLKGRDQKVTIYSVKWK